jgi:pimeloyl-ACP methyl ester carboxylesterase
MSKQAIESIVKEHERNGSYVDVDRINTFYLDIGSGPVVFCIHGVPTSSFLYRKVAFALQQRGLRAVAIDLPGLGLSDRPENFDYTFSSFARFCNHFLDALNIDEVHLIIHDIGTPVGLSIAVENGSRIKSITVLNSMLDVENFVKPLPMRPFEKPVLGEAELAMLTPATFPLMMKTAGVMNGDVISHDEMAAYIHLLKREDGGKAFLKIMRSFEQTKEFTKGCYAAFKNPAYPVQLIWGEKDPFLSYEQYGKQFEAARPGIPVTKVRSKHFLQEEQYDIIADKVKGLIVSSGHQVAVK